MDMPRLVVVYRTGGTANFKWHRTVTLLSQDEAESCARGVQAGGRPAIVYTEDELAEKGMPQTFDHPESR
jgi:hypothetical protein